MGPPGTHECATVGCRKVIPNHLLMCASHWAELPSYQKARVYALWSGVKNQEPRARHEYSIYVTAVKVEQAVRLGRIRCIENPCDKKAVIVLELEPLCQEHANKKAGIK